MQTQTEVVTVAPTCTAPISPLVNEDFSSELDHWAIDLSDAPLGHVEPTSGLEGGGVRLFCDASRSTYDKPTLHQNVPTCPGVAYDFTFHYRWDDGQDSNSQVYFYAYHDDATEAVVIMDTSSTEGKDSFGTPYGSWGVYSVPFTARSTTMDIRFTNICTNYGAIGIVIDSLSLDARQ